jgi:hypothetical protein
MRVRRNNSPPKIAIDRRDAYEKAILQELERRVETGEPISTATVAASAKYPDGTPVNRTTIYATRPDKTKVHQKVIARIEQAASRCKADYRPPPKPRSAAADMREIALLKALTTSLANDLHQAREGEQEALNAADTERRTVKSITQDAYVFASVVHLLTGTHHRVIRHRDSAVEQDAAFDDLLDELRLRANRLANQIRAGTAFELVRGKQT